MRLKDIGHAELGHSRLNGSMQRPTAIRTDIVLLMPPTVAVAQQNWEGYVTGPAFAAARNPGAATGHGKRRHLCEILNVRFRT